MATGAATLDAADTITVHADPDRLKHVFENLFRNAIEHGDDAVTVRVGAIDDRGFYVADDGRGVPAGEREAVFDPGHSTNEDGTGFGLAIVKEIVEAHGWAVSLTEGADGGARFEITGVEFA